MVKFLDKIDAFCEALHELLAGNTDVTVEKPNPYGRLAPVPFQYYPAKTRDLFTSFKYIRSLQQRHNHPFLQPVPAVDYKELSKTGRPHTLKSFGKPTGIDVYDAWIKTIRTHSKKEELRHYYRKTLRKI